MVRHELSAEAYRAIRDGTITERQWRSVVKELAAVNGWEILLEVPDRAYQVLAEAAARDRSLLPTLAILRGWPDLLIGHRGRGQHLAVELKTQRGKPNEWQLLKLPQLNQCGLEAHIWRPRNRTWIEDFLEGDG